MLNEADRDLVSELKSKFLLCKDRDAFAGVMRELQTLFAFTHWSAALCEMEGDHTVTSNYVFVNNFPDGFMEAYTASHVEFFDVIVGNHFCEKNFGELQYWGDTFKKTEKEQNSMPSELYRKHIHWRDFLSEWGILYDGFSIGDRTYADSSKTWFGSIVNYADDMEVSARTKEIIGELVKAQHAAILRVLKPELVT